MKTVHTFFVKNFIAVILPMFIPILVLGGLFHLIIKTQIKDTIIVNNSNSLHQTIDTFNLIFNELDAVSLYFSNPVIKQNLSRILKEPSLSSGDLTLFDTLRQFVNVPAITRPYIHSIYMYIPNDYGRFYNNNYGIDYLEQSYDSTWQRSLGIHEHESMWAEPRAIKEYSFEPPKEVITFYRRLNLGQPSGHDGILIMNISTDYINKQLEQLKKLPEQQFYVLDASRQLIISSAQSAPLTDNQIEEVAASELTVFTLPSVGGSNLISKVQSDSYNWSFVTVIAEKSLYKVPNSLAKLTFSLLAACFLIGAVLAFVLTRKNYHNVKTILNIIQSAQKGGVVSKIEKKPSDVYHYIIQNVLKTFVENNYLSVQLSERKYRYEVIELKALQSQMNPHFLLNTLQTIYWKVLELTGKPNEANAMLEHLGDILKFSLDVHAQLIPLEDELRYTRSYIEILKYRYRDKFSVVWDVYETVLHYHVTKLLLQPLVENALYHGIKNKKGTGIIRIKIRERGGQLVLSVTDNGTGMAPNRLNQIKSKLRCSLDSSDDSQTSHIGLSNTYKRLHLQFGASASLVIRSKPGWGTQVEIVVPLSLTNRSQV
ncbi:cache domain-containing sensor histidine kinase [Paenibacillus sp. SYP-B4298]|uniref:cache domain-containing sensor histidine kinase n=1 Tax=Paenibacillus sp. SYP-B4298 TaxID=2996034 RepID=UPI0022DCF508|nr:sensor histidine kinase [Paenibacillus sp. SYP-B4298]